MGFAFWPLRRASRRRRAASRSSRARRRPAFERLETRALLASDMAAIAGYAFDDLDGDGVFEPSAGEIGLAGATVQLTGTDDLGAAVGPLTATTGPDGSYRFDNLRAGDYQVEQLWPPPAGYFPSPGASPVSVTITSADAAGVQGTPIDTFDGEAQQITVSSIGPTSDADSVADAVALGGTRDIFAELTSPTGNVTLNVNWPSVPDVLEINSNSASTGNYIITWDGDLNPFALDPTGLGGIDLTDGGASTGVQLLLGVDKSGETFELRIYTDAANWSSALVALPDTGGLPSAEVFIPFDTGFAAGAGSGADFTNVGAVQLEIDASVDAMDGQIDFLGAIGPTVLTADLANTRAAPGIQVEKATSGQDADSPPGPHVAVGGDVTFTYVVTNTGNVPLASVDVSDDQGVAVTFQSGDEDGDGLLDTDETWIYQGSATVTAGQYANTATATGDPADESGRDLPGLDNVTDTDPSHHFGAVGGVAIQKAVNGEDADLPPGPYLPSGSSVTFTYVVTNTGNVPLGDVAVTDDQGVTPSLQDGDTDGDGLLDTDETWTYQGVATAVPGQYENTGRVVANPVDPSGLDIAGLPDVTASDLAHYFGAAASVDIEKATEGDDADSGTGPLLAEGDTAHFTYVVTNTGNVPLGDVDVSDDQGVAVAFAGGDTDGDGLLDTDETWTYAASAVVAAGQYQNVGTVTGNPVEPDGTDIAGAADVSDSDPSRHFGVVSGIDVEKATQGVDADAPPGPSRYEGFPVTFAYEVRNTGNVELTNISLVDDNGTPADPTDDFTPTFVDGDADGDNALDVDEVWRYTAAAVATLGQYGNQVEASGQDPLARTVRDTDPSHYLGEELPPVVSKRRFLASMGW